MTLRRPLRVSAVAVACLMVPAVAFAESFAFYHDDVLGTSLELRVEAVDETAAGHAERAVLAEIDRLARVWSTYDPASEVSRWIAAGEFRVPGDELAVLLRACDRWRESSGGAFHPGVAAATAVWRRAEREGCPPEESRLAEAAAALRHPPWTWRGREVRPQAGTLTLDAIAKGAIVDAACRAAVADVGATGVLLNVGGDVAVRGTLESEVTVASPDHAATGGGVLDRVVVSDAAIATSGGAVRGFTVAGRWHSHVIDPRTARPADGVRSASVVAPTAADADALATICCVLSPAASLRLVDTVPGASCLILDRAGRVHASPAWPGVRFGPQRTAATTVAFGSGAAGGPQRTAGELVLELEINRPAGGRGYRRPYVAAWIEDADGFPVKTLVLWVQKDGQRWLPDLKRWHRADRLRKLAEDTDLVKTVSEATRQPGRHAVTWDGLDNSGVPLPPGEYVVCIEAAREHGTYQFDRRTVTLGGASCREVFDAGTEIAAATLEYRAPAETR